MRTDWHARDLAHPGWHAPAGPPAHPWGFAPLASPMPMAAAEARPQSLWQAIDDRLRGRWRWALITAAALGLVLALVGWTSSGPLYESVGVIRVTPRVPVTLEAIPEVELTQFAMFVNTQVELIRSRRVLENALEDEDVASLEWAQDEEVLSELDENLELVTDRSSELIHVAYAAEEPRTAQAVVNAVIRSYYEIYGQAGGNAVGDTLDRLRAVEAQFQRQLQQVRAETARLHHRYETSDLLALQAQTMARHHRLEQLIDIAERNLTAVTTGATGAAIVSGEAMPVVLEHLEEFDPRLAELRQQRDSAENEFNAVRRRYRPGSAAYVMASSRVETARALFEDQYFAALGVWESSSALAPGDIEDVSFAGFSAPRLGEKITAMREQQALLERRSQDLLVDMQQLEDRRLEQERLQADLERTRARIQALELEEQNIAARITVEQEGFRPQTASSDRRRKRAIMGLAGGCLAGLGIFLAWGTIDRRAFGARQLRTVDRSDPAVLGVLPDLGPGPLDPQSTDVAAHCVHQIRNQIEARREQRSGYVLGITSPFQGDGKTSIVLALGWSYAVAGHRTLVVDCDLVGRSLTRQLGMSGRSGLKEALAARDATGLVTSVAGGSLEALPVGASPLFGPESLRRVDLAAVIEGLRDQYEMIIIDTGPLLGSLESIPVAAIADAIVLSVRRGRSRTRLEECAAALASVGGRCLGVILNCAARSDCNRYVSEASAAEAAVRAGDAEQDPRGVLVRAMELTTRRTRPPGWERDTVPEREASVS